MSFNHTSTFLRSSLLENPDFLGNLLDAEDVLRIEREYPELFTTAFDVQNLRKKSSPSRLPCRVPDRFTRLSQSAEHCKREKCKPPEPRQLKTSEYLQRQQSLHNKNKMLFQKRPISGSAVSSGHLQERRPTKIKSFTIRNDNNLNDSLRPRVTGSSPLLKGKEHPQQPHPQKSPTLNSVSVRKSVSAPVAVANKNSSMTGAHDKLSQVIQSRLPKYQRPKPEADNIKMKSDDPPKSKAANSQIDLKTVKPNLPLTSSSAPPSPRAPHKSNVTMRHASKSKPSGFLKPVPILLKQKSQAASPSKKYDTDKLVNKILSTISSSSRPGTLPTDLNALQQGLEKTGFENLIDRKRNENQCTKTSNLKEIFQTEREIALTLSDILEERETETEMGTGNKSNADYSDSFISTCSSISVDAFVGDRNFHEPDKLLGSERAKDADSFINIKSDFQFKDPILQEDRQSYLVQASVNRCEQLLLAKFLASKYEKEGKFRKLKAGPGDIINQNDTRHKNPPENQNEINKPGTSCQTQPMHSSSSSSPAAKSSSKVVSFPSSAAFASKPVATPIHDVILENFVQQNKSFETVLKEKPMLLEKIAHDLIYEEVLKILREENDFKLNHQVEGKSPTMVNKCVGTTSRLKSASRIPKVSSSVPVVGTSNLNSHLSSKIQCEVKPRARSTNSEKFESLSGYSESMKTVSDSGSKKSNETNLLELKLVSTENEVPPNPNRKENDQAKKNYSDSFDEITGSRSSGRNVSVHQSPLLSAHKSKSNSTTGSNSKSKSDMENENINIRNVSDQKLKEASSGNTQTPLDTPPERPETTATKFKNMSSNNDVSGVKQKPMTKQEQTPNIHIEKTDKTECDCSELDDDENFISSERSGPSGSLDDGHVDGSDREIPQIKDTQNQEESIKDISPPKFSLLNSPSEIAVGTGSDVDAAIKTCSDSNNSQSQSTSSPVLSKNLQPLQTENFEPGQSSSLVKEAPEDSETPRSSFTPHIPSPSPTLSVAEKEKVPERSEEHLTSKSKMKPQPKPQAAKVQFNDDENVCSESDSNNVGVWAIQQLLEEAEKLHLQEPGDEDEADSIPIPTGSEGEEKLYKEIIAEINSSNTDNRSSDVYPHNMNLSMSQSQDKDKTELESSCASILDDLISDGELVIDDSEEKSPGEMNTSDFNGYHFSPGFYTKIITKR